MLDVATAQSTTRTSAVAYSVSLHLASYLPVKHAERNVSEHAFMDVTGTTETRMVLDIMEALNHSNPGTATQRYKGS